MRLKDGVGVIGLVEDDSGSDAIRLSRHIEGVCGEC